MKKKHQVATPAEPKDASQEAFVIANPEAGPAEGLLALGQFLALWALERVRARHAPKKEGQG